MGQELAEQAVSLRRFVHECHRTRSQAHEGHALYVIATSFALEAWTKY
jgi:hypothetical protein